MKTKLLVFGVFLASLSFGATADATSDALRMAMASDLRSTAEVQRDRNRKPLETLAFFGFQKDMTVVELVPGAGWYTKLLAPVLNDEGQYIAAIGTNRIKSTLVDKPGFERMQIVAEDASLSRDHESRFYALEMSSLGVTDADMVLTFRNYHNLAESARATLNQAVFDALKPGGIYGVVDHTRRHMEPTSASNGRRVDPVMVIKEVQAAGFQLVDYSTLHYREDDELEYEVGARSVAGNTDRFTLKFIKPKQ